MTEMLNRVGGAILLAETQWGPKSGVSKERAMALAALEALREPTEAMCNAGTEFLGKYLDVGGAYAAMISAALDVEK
jgi:hypothetical protein